MKKVQKIASSKNFTAVNIGSLDQLSEYGFPHPATGQLVTGKVFLKDQTDATGTQISYNVLPPKTELPYFHTHQQNEESYLILSGSGQFQVDDHCFEIGEGSIVRVAPGGNRGMTNTSDAPMIYIVIQSQEGSLHQHSMEDGVRVTNTPKWR